MDKTDRKNDRLVPHRIRAMKVDLKAAQPEEWVQTRIPLVWLDMDSLEDSLFMMMSSRPTMSFRDWESRGDIRQMIRLHTCVVMTPIADLAFLYEPSSETVHVGTLGVACHWCKRTRTIPNSTGSIASRCTCLVGPSIPLSDVCLCPSEMGVAYRHTAQVRRQIYSEATKNTSFRSGLSAWSDAFQSSTGWRLPQARSIYASLKDVLDESLFFPPRSPLHG